jgi:hypothetical protein
MNAAAPLSADTVGPRGNGWTQPPKGGAYELARELAGPVARGWLTLTVADAALIVRVSQCPGEYDLLDTVRFAQHLLRQLLQKEEDRRALARSRIKNTLGPMIARRAPKNHLFAEAHGVNGEMGFPLMEAEVTAVVVEQVWWALPAPPRTSRRVG